MTQPTPTFTTFQAVTNLQSTKHESKITTTPVGKRVWSVYWASIYPLGRETKLFRLCFPAEPLSQPSRVSRYHLSVLLQYHSLSPRKTYCRRWAWVLNCSAWRHGTCTCPMLLKQQKCKQVLGIGVRLKLTKIPPSPKDASIGQKRRCGRPKKASLALRFDWVHTFSKSV